ncbi:hypothetical protein GN244_ATG01086 [Phytophthora infestans]|uniref:Uncharacterized protein n=1 Tax=Phytophthora infestans TaxID=4787 RepID=A0A833TGY9_PHYIN|nr:hypothetical protein GN244_ATG01086 [Phytophthora infestans]
MTSGKTLLKQIIETEHDANKIRYFDDVNEEQESHARSGSEDVMNVKDKVRQKRNSYLCS